MSMLHLSTNLKKKKKKCRFYYKYPFLLFDNYCCVWLVRQLLLEFPQDLRFIVLKYFEKCVPLGLQIHTKPRCPCPSPSQWLSLSVAWSSSHLFCVVDFFQGHFSFACILHNRPPLEQVRETRFSAVFIMTLAKAGLL